MEFGWSEEDLTFRKEVRAFLDAELGDAWTGPTAVLGSPENVTFSRRFAAALAERGWLTPHWPVEHGGSAASSWQHAILGEELWSIGEPRGPQYMNVNWIGPSIMRFGTDEQRRDHLPRIASGDVIWCQGFSEPEAGSDLGALRTRAVRDADEYVVNGQKVWTSYASVADFCYLLVRTGSEESGNRGITVLLVPMDLPGLEVREVGSVVGDHAFHELFLTDLRVPSSCRLGAENDGWEVVRQALAYERVGAPRWARAQHVLDELAAWARGTACSTCRGFVSGLARRAQQPKRHECSSTSSSTSASTTIRRRRTPTWPASRWSTRSVSSGASPPTCSARPVSSGGRSPTAPCAGRWPQASPRAATRSS